MGDHRDDDAENDAPRSYCVFERDRDLPRPTPWRPLTAAPSRPKMSASVVMRIAAAVVLGAAALAWWLAS